MLKVLLILVYIYNGEAKLEQEAFDDSEVCLIAGQIKAEAVMADPLFQKGLIAQCVEIKQEEKTES
jgi:hypothetical protein